MVGMDRKYGAIIADRVRTLCKRRDISISKLAEMSGLKQSTLDSIINGRSLNPKARTLHKIALAFNMTFAEFVNFPAMNDYSFEKDDEDEEG